MIALIILLIIVGIIILAANVAIDLLEALLTYMADKLEGRHPAIRYTWVFLMCVVPIATTYFIVDKYT